MEKQSIGVGLIGLGTIAGQVAKVLRDRAALLSEQAGCPIVLKKIKILPQDMERPLAKELDSRLFTTDSDGLFSEPGIDIVVEAIGGENPAFEYLRRSLWDGKHVVTSNKEVIAKHGAELRELARQKNVDLRYEASVGGGIPLIHPLRADLVANRINGIYAIINGTTNYILTRMAKEGADFAATLKKAQELGYAEANPRDDVEGIDATYKLAILASLSFQMKVLPQDIHSEGISRLHSKDFRYAKELGFAIKLLAIAKQDDHFVEVRVHPVLIPENSLLAKVDGVFNGILVVGDLVGDVLFYGQGAGPLPTSSAVVADIVAIAHDIRCGVSRSRVRWEPKIDKTIKPMADVVTRYYLRMNVADQPGVLAQISKILGDNLISISSLIQKDADASAQTAEIVIMTHPAREADMQRALTEMGKMSVVKEISNFIRVEL